MNSYFHLPRFTLKLSRVKLIIFGLIVIVLILLISPRVSAQSDRNYYYNNNQSWTAFPEPRVSKSFSSNERRLIWQSLAKAQEQLQRRQVYNCINQYVTRGYPNGNKPDEMVRASLTFFPMNHRIKGRRMRLYINKIEKENRVLGQAVVGIDPYKSDFNISLNAYNLSSGRFPQETTWAGVIVHELLHNWNYSHAKNVDPKKPEQVAGNFVYESGWCVAREGRDKLPGAFGLTGNGFSDPSEVFVD